jgi:hypothetical protein
MVWYGVEPPKYTLTLTGYASVLNSTVKQVRFTADEKSMFSISGSDAEISDV